MSHGVVRGCEVDEYYASLLLGLKAALDVLRE